MGGTDTEAEDIAITKKESTIFATGAPLYPLRTI